MESEYKKFHADLIDLVCWIENNIDKEINIKIMSEISGYGFWYIQNLFRTMTGLRLKTYIRMRKLTMAAIELRFTDKQIIHIAEKYGWGSQQSFTRCFSKHFSNAPYQWRHAGKVNYSLFQTNLKITLIKSEDDAIIRVVLK